MKAFKDNNGRDWMIDVNVDTIKRVRGLLKVDLLQAVEGKLAKQLADDPILLVDVIFAAVKPQADAAGVTDEQFGRAMRGDAVGDAAMALLEDLADFFPTARRTILRGMLEKSVQVEARTFELAKKKLDATSVETLMELLEAEAKAEQAQKAAAAAEATATATTAAGQNASPLPTSGGSSTSSPAGSASTPAD